MKYAKLFLFVLTVLTAASMAANAQDGPPPDDRRAERPDGSRPNLLAELGLSREQIQQIRRMNQERRPAMMRAQQRMREANRALDMAIYRDTVNEEEFQTRLKEHHAAQAELARLRFESELAVRRVLTPDQLVRFRDLRRRFAEAREGEMRRRRMRRNRPALPPVDHELPSRPPQNN